MSRYIDAEPFDKMCVLVVFANERPVDAVFRMIHEAPTADVAPVVHGEWVIDENSAYIDAHCSECGMQVRYNKFQQFDCFCRRCGAKMDGER